MKTRIYVDGYNFYYGLLEGTRYKWLNIDTLIEQIVHSIKPSSVIDKIYYFTSPVIANLSTHGKGSPAAQNTYLQALKTVSDRIEVINGYHNISHKKAPARLEGQKNQIDRSVQIFGISKKNKPM